MNNPFLFGKTVTENFFTNREYETDRLISNINSNLNTIIVSPRRYGKSSLVKNIANKKIKDTVFVFIDIYNIRSEEEFYTKFATKLVEATNSKFEERIKTFKQYLSALSPSFSIGTELEGSFKISLNLSGASSEIEEILNLPEKIAKQKKVNIVICLDEFQNIEFFEKPLAFQKTCRSYWQHHNNVSYILYGSKQYMLTNLFQSRSAPFYRFGDVIHLGKIETSYLVNYIVARFASTDKFIDIETATKLVEYVKNHPYYTQQLAYILWNLSDKESSLELLLKAKELLLDQNTVLYQSDAEGLSNAQINFLKMIIVGEKSYSSKLVIDKYKLNSSANVNRAKKALVKKEIIEAFKTNISFYDPVFELWLKERYYNLG